MSIFASELAEPRKPRSLLRSILKHLILAALAGSLVLAAYLHIREEQDTDKTIGRFAYINGKDEYLGVIRWHGRSRQKGLYVYQIKTLTGDLIEVDDSYVVVRDNPPKTDD